MGSEKQEHYGKSIETNQVHHDISHLERRELQVPLIVDLLSSFIEEIGHERTMKIACAAIQEDAKKSGKTQAERPGGNSLKALKSILQDIWAEGDALEYQVLEETDHKLSYDVTRCRYAEMYDRLGYKEFGYCLSCSRDPAFIKGFNPRMKLVRTRTIMQGAELCDFRFVLEEE